MDKNTKVLEYLLTCPNIAGTPLYFNLINAKNDSKQFITTANDKYLNRTYIDGSIAKQYQFTLIIYKALSDNSVVNGHITQDENIEDMFDIQALIDWITEQEYIHNYPDFGEDCVVEAIATTTENPSLNVIDMGVSPNLAEYSITININYIDYSKIVWNKQEG